MQVQLAAFLIWFVLGARSQAPVGGDCHNGQGTCVDSSRCVNNNWISNLCQGPENIKCCMKTSITAGGTYQAPARGIYTSDYGPRSCTGCSSFHRGIDIANDVGSPVMAAAAGTVNVEASGCKVGETECGGRFGNWIAIKHGNGDITAYAHLSAIVVASGQTVVAGAQIGAIGNTGSSQGPHLHFEVWKGGDSGNRVDPCKNGLTCPALNGSF